MSSTALVASSTTKPGNSALINTPRPQSTPPSAISTTVLPTLSPALQAKGATPSQSTTSTPPPNKQSQPFPAGSLATPGRWQHPRMNEIIRRQSRTNFDTSNIYAILWNVAFLLASLAVHPTLNKIVPVATLHSIGSLPTYALLALRLTFLLNIAFALAPLFRRPDSCEDIPLSPSQRQLFGLPPLSRPATPQEKEQYITPPRYARSASATPRSSSSSLHAEVSGSPVDFSTRRTSFTGSPAFRSPSGSPAGGLQSHRGGGSGERRKLSYTANRGSPLSFSEFDVAGSVNTPSKTATKRASVALNSKWLYEKGKANASAWGTGSVFS